MALECLLSEWMRSGLSSYPRVWFMNTEYSSVAPRSGVPKYKIALESLIFFQLFVDIMILESPPLPSNMVEVKRRLCTCNSFFGYFVPIPTSKNVLTPVAFVCEILFMYSLSKSSLLLYHNPEPLPPPEPPPTPPRRPSEPPPMPEIMEGVSVSAEEVQPVWPHTTP